MAITKPIPVKLSDEVIQKLDKISESTGLNNRSSLIRLCLQSFLDYFEKHGEAALPLNWREILADNDGRKNLDLLPEKLKAAERKADYNISRPDNRS